MSRIQIKAITREKTKKLKNKLGEDFIPAVSYDQKTNSKNIKIDYREFEKVIPEIDQTTILELIIDEKKPQLALVRDVQIDVRTNRIQHVSFMILDPKKETDLRIAIKFTGISPAIKNNLGIFVPIKDFIELRGIPSDAPESLEIDISELANVGDRVSAQKLEIPENFSLIRDEDANLILATIRPFQKLEEIATTSTTEDEEEGKEVNAEDEETTTEGSETEESTTSTEE